MRWAEKGSPGVFLALLTAVWLLPGVIFCGMRSGDETRVAGIVAEMVLKNEWVVPRLNGMPFLEYPPLYYWWCGLFFRLFGITEHAAALASMCAAAGSVWLVRRMALRLGASPAAAVAAGFFLLASAQFLVESSTVRVDILLTFFITLAYGGFFDMVRPGAESPGRGAAVRGAILLALGVCGGVMTKGLIGAVLPAAGMGTWLVLDDVFARKWRWRRYLAVGAAFMAATIPVLLWGVLLYRAQGAEAVRTVAIVNNFGRFSGSQGDHASPVCEYLLKLPAMFQPFLVLVFAGLWCLFRRVRQTCDGRALAVLTYLLMPYLVLSLASAKRMVYMLPLAPAAALAAAAGGAYLLTVFPKLGSAAAKIRPQLLLLVLVPAGLAVQTGMVLVRRHHAPEDSVRAFWAEVGAVSRREARAVVLINVPERTSGAAMFYLGHTVAERREAMPLSGRRELYILRNRRRDENSNADWHRMFRIPEDAAKLPR